VINKKIFFVLGLVMFIFICPVYKTCAAPPLPPQSIEGTGGICITSVAYLVNPAQKNKVFGMPVFGLSYVNLRDKDLVTATFTETLWGRVELGYALNNLQLGDLRGDIDKMTGLDAGYNHVQLHHFNLRLNLIPEGGFGHSWMPAITAGVHYKNNSYVDSLNRRLGGVLRAIGVHDNDGVDYTLVGTKMITNLMPKPLLLTAGIRWTKACHLGLLGFSDDYNTLGEFSIAQFLTDRLIFVSEYRMKPDELSEIPDLVEEEDGWWTVGLAYIINDNSTFSICLLHTGQLLDEYVNNGLALRLVFEF